MACTMGQQILDRDCHAGPLWTIYTEPPHPSWLAEFYNSAPRPGNEALNLSRLPGQMALPFSVASTDDMCLLEARLLRTFLDRKRETAPKLPEGCESELGGHKLTLWLMPWPALRRLMFSSDSFILRRLKVCKCLVRARVGVVSWGYSGH